MKKFLYFAMMAMLAMPLIMSCEKKDYDPRNPEDPFNPEDPNSHVGSEEWFDNWTKGDKEDAITMNVENLIGKWDLIIFALKANDSVAPIDSRVYQEDDFYDHEYLELRKNKEFVTHRLNQGQQQLIEGTWEVENNKIIFSSVAIQFSNGQPLKITVLEEDRLVLKCQYSHDDEVYCYFVFKRIENFPELPKPNIEIITANGWKITSDTTTCYERKGHIDSLDVFTPYEDAKVAELKINQYKGSTMMFYPDGTFIFKNAEGKLIADAQWSATDEATGELSVYFYETIDKEFMQNVEIPGIGTSLRFKYFKEDNNAIMTGEVFYIIDKEEEKAKWEEFLFHVDPAK